MTMSSDADVTIVENVEADAGSYVDWSAIIAGIVLASGISLVLLTFGSAIGLSFADFRGREGASMIWIGIAAASWLLWVQISSFMAGGYLTGRLRKRHRDATEHEVDVRDGAHGLLVWGGALIVGALIAAGGIGAVANAVGSAAATLTNAASNVADDAAAAIDPNAYFVDVLFRPEAAAGEPAAAEATAAEPAAAATPAPGAAPAAGTTVDTTTPAVSTNAPGPQAITCRADRSPACAPSSASSMRPSASSAACAASRVSSRRKRKPGWAAASARSSSTKQASPRRRTQ